MRHPTDKETLAFRRRIWRFYREHKRSLPFRDITDPYRITVSEFMLQQTQVSRVVPKYNAWVRRWKSWRALAGASRREVLQLWSGLGYNRRAVFLHELAKKIRSEYNGRLPNDRNTLKTLPGIGEYTSAAILIFANNSNLSAVDTNIRQVLIAEFDLPDSVGAGELQKLAERVAPRGRARDWHYALMDYAALKLDAAAKRRIAKPKQSRFKGSLRQIRGEIIRQLTEKQCVTIKRIAEDLERSESDTRNAAETLAADGMIRFTANTMKLVE